MAQDNGENSRKILLQRNFGHNEKKIKNIYVYVDVFFGAFKADLFVLFQFIGKRSLIAHQLQMMRKYGLYRSK